VRQPKKKAISMIDQERLDLPSASSAHRRRRCVGSENLIRELRSQGLLKEIPPSEDAQSGTLVHAAWAGQNVELTQAQSVTLEELRRLEALVVADWSGQDPYVLVGREERLWLREGLEPVLSGQFDVAYRTVSTHRVLILDAKTLYGEIQSAEYNDQLRELVALFCSIYPRIERFRVAILSPNLAERCSLADYDAWEAQLALRLTRLSLAESRDPEAPRIPGAYCTHCPAVLQCEEARQLVGNTFNLAKRIEAGEFRLPLGPKGSRILDNIKVAKTVLKALEDAYKRELAATADCLPGWRLKPGKRMREILEVDKALEVAVQAGFTLGEFLACTELAIGRLQDRLGARSSISGRALSNQFESVFGELVSVQQYAPELERVKTRALKNH
jgi:hypothetical protein